MLIVICFPQLKYKEDYNKNVKGQWCETPYFDVATARVAMENLSNVRAYYYLRRIFSMVCLIFQFITVLRFSFQRRYTQDFEDIKDQIYFMQTDTPVYDTNKKARIAASEVSPHTTQKYESIFIGPTSCGRHDRELTCVSEQSVSQHTESTLTQGSQCFVPTHPLHD